MVLFYVEKHRSLSANTELLVAGKCGKASSKTYCHTVMMSIRHGIRSSHIFDAKYKNKSIYIDKIHEFIKCEENFSIIY